MLDACRLTRHFGPRVAVSEVSFKVQAGEVFGLLGPNGAGKTTILRILGGLIPPTSGKLTINGRILDPSSAREFRGIMGFLTETPGLWDQLTVHDNLAIYGRLFGVADVPAAVERALRRFALWDRRQDRAARLSKGMKQKVALARALLHDPEIVLLDEPTANLDPHTAREVRDLLLDLRRRGRAIVVSSHNLDEIERLADRVALVRTTLIAEGEPSALRERLFGRRLRVRLADGDASLFVTAATQAGASEVSADRTTLSMAIAGGDAAVIPAIVRAIVEAGAPIREVVEESAPLEEVYIRLLESPPGIPQ